MPRLRRWWPPPAGCGGRLDGLRHQFEVGGGALAGKELQPHVKVTTGVERRAAQLTANEVSTNCGCCPGQSSTVEKFDVRRESCGAGRQPECRSAEASLGAELQLDERAGGELVAAVVGQDGAQKARFVDG